MHVWRGCGRACESISEKCLQNKGLPSTFILTCSLAWVHTVRLSKTHCFRLSFCHQAWRPSQPPDWLSAPRSFVDPVRRQCARGASRQYERSASSRGEAVRAVRGGSAVGSARKNGEYAEEAGVEEEMQERASAAEQA